MNLRKCKHCLKEFDTSEKPKGWMANHSRWCDENPKKKSYIEKSAIAVKAMCDARINNGNLNQFVKAKNEGRTISVSAETKAKISQSQIGRTCSDSTKKILSEKRKQWLKDNPDLHPWKRSDKFVSAPCEKLKQILINEGLDIAEEYIPLEDRFFSIDIAIPSHKIAIEVNGNQHYSDVSNRILSEYYKQRHDLIVADGWNVIEYHYSDVYKNESVENLIKNIKCILSSMD